MAHLHEEGLGLVHQPERAQPVEEGQPTEQGQPEQRGQPDGLRLAQKGLRPRPERGLQAPLLHGILSTVGR